MSEYNPDVLLATKLFYFLTYTVHLKINDHLKINFCFLLEIFILGPLNPEKWF